MGRPKKSETGDTNTQESPAYVRVADRLREDILSGTWAMGKHVPMSHLTSRYGVSGMPIRDALNQLVGEGLVQIQANKGFVISDVDEQFLHNIYDIRSVVIPMLAAKAAKRIDNSTLEEVEELGRQFAEAARSGRTADALKLNRIFHRTIYKAAENPMALEILQGRVSLIFALRLKQGYRDERVETIIAEHDAIISALHARDPEWCESATRVHVLSGKMGIFKHFITNGHLRPKLVDAQKQK